MRCFGSSESIIVCDGMSSALGPARSKERRTALRRGAQSDGDVLCPGCNDIDVGVHENLGVKSRLSSADQVNVN